jgi:hypothetical protein
LQWVEGISLWRHLNTFTRQASETVVITSDGGSVEATTEHPFWVIERRWMPAVKLQAGDQLSGRAGATFTVHTLTKRRSGWWEKLRTAGWREKALRAGRKGDSRKVRMAGGLQAETAMSWNWIAKRLAMGHWRTASNAMRAGLK